MGALNRADEVAETLFAVLTPSIPSPTYAVAATTVARDFLKNINLTMRNGKDRDRDLTCLLCGQGKTTMIEARKSAVDGLWRAWGEFSTYQLGLVSAEDIAEGVPEQTVWVCVAVGKTRWGAIEEALAIAKRRTPQYRKAA